MDDDQEPRSIIQGQPAVFRTLFPAVPVFNEVL